MPDPSPERVLLIDDHAPSRRGYAEYLNRFGFSVLEAADGTTGLTTAITCRPDIIVLDLSLPDIDGWSIARELRASAATRSVPIIALTGADLPHERASALRAGCDLHLGKPCMPGVLLDALRLFARGHGHRHDTGPERHESLVRTKTAEPRKSRDKAE